MNIDDIYEAAPSRGLVRSKRYFSKALLRRAPNYLADTAPQGCSVDALLNLYLALAGHPDLQALAFARLLESETRRNGAGVVST